MSKKIKRGRPGLRRRPMKTVPEVQIQQPPSTEVMSFLDYIDACTTVITEAKDITLDTPVQGVFMAAWQVNGRAFHMIPAIATHLDKKDVLITLLGSCITAMIGEGVSKDALLKRLHRDVLEAPGPAPRKA